MMISLGVQLVENITIWYVMQFQEVINIITHLDATLEEIFPHHGDAEGLWMVIGVGGSKRITNDLSKVRSGDQKKRSRLPNEWSVFYLS